MIISTCNRTEIYFEFENHIGDEKKFLHSIVKELSEFRSFKDSLSPYLTKKTGSYEVAKHLFRLVSGLESMMIGEFQIVEQLKEAYYFSRDKKMLGPILSRMIQKSLETGKYIRTNTEIGKGAVSVSYAAIEEITKRFDLSLSSFLCVGLGETSKLSIRHLHQKKISNIKIANRTDKKAVEFSKELNLDTIKFKNFKKEMESIDVAIFCTSSKKPIIKKDELIDISSRRDNELLILDLSVPRNIPISAYEVNDINVINIDNLKDTVNENYKKRRKEIGKAEKQIEELEISLRKMHSESSNQKQFKNLSQQTKFYKEYEDQSLILKKMEEEWTSLQTKLDRLTITFRSGDATSSVIQDDKDSILVFRFVCKKRNLPY